MVLAALVPVVFAQPYIRWQRGLAFAVITAGCVLALVVLARFQHFAHLAVEPPRWIETAFILVALPVHAFHILVDRVEQRLCTGGVGEGARRARSRSRGFT